MSYIFKFEPSDKFVNTVKNYPAVSFVIHGGHTFYNNRLPISGAWGPNVLIPSLFPPDVRTGHISLYEQNIDRAGSLPLFASEIDPLTRAVLLGQNPGDPLLNYQAGPNPPITPFVIKDGTRVSFKTVSIENFNTLSQFGDVISSTYPLTASITKEFYSATTPRYTQDVWTYSDPVPPALAGVWSVLTPSSVSHLYALKNTINYYKHLSPHFVVSSATIGGGRNLMASSSGEGGNIPVGLVSVPSIFYGSGMKKGSVSLKFYVSGTLIGELKDEKRNGELIQSGPYGSSGSGSVAGLALYNEGFFILTGSWLLSDTHSEDYTGSAGAPNWICFAQTIAGSGFTAPSSSFSIDFKGITKIPTLTLFAHAPRNTLNHSNNPTYIKYGEATIESTGALGYIQKDTIAIKNIVSSSYNDPTGSFKKVTYISQIGIYDGNKNLLGVAKLANPVKKLEERDITFKLKLDI